MATHEVRRQWGTPELIVLVRKGPEEAVLTTCKLRNTSYTEPTPGATDQSCQEGTPTCGTDCSDISAS